MGTLFSGREKAFAEKRTAMMANPTFEPPRPISLSRTLRERLGLYSFPPIDDNKKKEAKKMVDWSEHLPEGFERWERITKEGKIEIEFLDEGRLVSPEQTGFQNASVVFNVKEDGKTKELWWSIRHPILRKLSEHKPLVGKTAVIEFSGKGMKKYAELVEVK